MQTFNYISITKMPEYAHKSFEEHRFDDYQKGNKGSAAPAASPLRPIIFCVQCITNVCLAALL